MTKPQNPLLLPFLKLAPQDQANIANELFNTLETLLIENRTAEIPALRQKMNLQYGMAPGTFQQYLEEIYNVQIQTIIDDKGNDVDRLKFFLTAIPITFFPDHEIDEDVWVDTFLGRDNTEWAQEIAAAMVKAGYLHGEDIHYTMPVLFDIHDLFKTPEESFLIISDIISGNLSLKHPPKPFKISKDDLSVTRYFIMATGTRDLERKTAIIPSIYDCFTQFSDMQQTIESIVHHYWCEHSYYAQKDYDVCAIVGAATDGASGLRMKQPSDTMGVLAYHAIKAIEHLDKRDLKVVVDKNMKRKSISIDVYKENKCVMSFKYPQLQLAEGFEVAMFSYVLDTTGLSHYRVIESDNEDDPSEKIKKPLLRIIS